jgi:hypothetical protein
MAIVKIKESNSEEESEDYPEYVIEGVKESLQQAEDGKLTPYIGIKEMLNHA